MTTGAVVATQAGHPHPAIQRADGTVEYCGQGGLPVGLLPDASYEDFDVALNAGDRLFLMSDGITECPGEYGDMLDEDGVVKMLNRNASVRGSQFLEAVMWDLNKYSGGQDFPDDISAILLEFNGQA